MLLQVQVKINTPERNTRIAEAYKEHAQVSPRTTMPVCCVCLPLSECLMHNRPAPSMLASQGRLFAILPVGTSAAVTCVQT